MSRHWMYNADRRSQDFIEGLHYFLGVAEANKRDGFMCCPCALCKNLKEYSSSMSLHSHLLKSGFMSNYICWTKHGESGVMMEEGEGEDLDIDDIIAQYGAFDDTTMGGDEEEVAVEDDLGDALGDAIRDAQQEWESEKEKVKFERMLEDHRKLLYPTAEEGQKKLGTTLELLQWKAKNGISDKAFGNLLNLIKKMLPKPNELPTTTYEAKKVVCPLGLKIQKIHACPNDCILYHGNEYENLDECPVCKASRYKIRRDDPGDVEGEQRPRKKIPAKVMWYAPIIPRLKRLFRNKDHAKLLRWYKEDRKVDNMLRHPADGSQWRAIDREFPEFANEARNLRCRKVVYLGHRRFLPLNHQVRKKGKHFKGKPDHRKKPHNRTGEDVLAMVKDVKVVFGKGQGSESVPKDAKGHAPMWKKKSIFWELPYWQVLEVRNAIDVMHLTKNLCVNLLGFMGVYGKPKDSLEARQDLQGMKERDNLHPEKTDDGPLNAFFQDTGLTLDQLTGKAPIQNLEVDTWKTYKYGKSLYNPAALNELGTQMYLLNKWYMQACGRGEQWIFVRFRDHHYFRGDDILHISFEELHQLYHMDALDKSIISSFCLFQMSELQRIQDTSVGFIDPYIVFKTGIIVKERWVSEAQENIMMFFVKQHDKTTILFPYNFEVWKEFIRQHRKDCKAPLNNNLLLVQWCLRQEPGNNLCGYYVCEFITAHIRRTPEDVLRTEWLKRRVMQKDHLKAVQESIAGYLLEKVLNPNGEFYFDPKE
ncbi:uncharacterized protein [Miscanthus floridulus]|uniref:uncharacterized protein n=1 Tax=Miscanthus floridulus TaxID=154761 RepID=UPI00345ADAA4